MPSFYVTKDRKVIKIKTGHPNEIVATIYKVDDCRALKKEHKFSFSCKQKVEILTVKNVHEALTGETIPCVLIKLDKFEKFNFYLVAICLDNSKFIPLRKVDTSSGDILEKFYLLDGPSLLSITTNSTVNIYISESQNMCQMKGNAYKLPSCSCVCSSTPSLHSYLPGTNDNNVSDCDLCTIVLYASCENKEYLLFLKQSYLCTCVSEGKKSKTNLVILKYSCTNGFTFVDGNIFVPEEYHSTLTCLHYTNQKLLLSDMYKVVDKVIIGTSEGFVIELENGHLVRCLSLSPDGLLPPSVVVEEIYYPSNFYVGINGFLVLQNNNVIAVNGNFQVFKKWAGISKIICGWLVDGTEFQYLLFRGNNLHHGWILTDLDTLEIKSDGPVSDQDDADTDYNDKIGSAVQALQSRLQKERLLLYEKEQDCRKTETFVREVVTRQVQLMEGRAPDKMHEPDLLPLIEGSSQNAMSASQKPEVEDHPDIEVMELWQRTYGGKWLIGISFRNTSNRDLTVSMNIVPSNTNRFPNTLTCYSAKYFSKSKLTRTNRSELPKTKSKHPRFDNFEAGSTCSANVNPFELKKAKTPLSFDLSEFNRVGQIEPELVTCKTDIPNFSASDIYSVQVFLKWKRTKGDHSNRGESLNPIGSGEGVGSSLLKNGGNVTSCSKYCGEMVLRSEDVILGNHELNIYLDTDLNDIDMQDIKDAKKDLIAMRTLQQTTPLEIRSCPSILSSLDQLLIDRCSFMYNNRLSCYATKIQSLARAQIQLNSYTGGDRRLIKVNTSCNKDLFLLVHHLYACLPDHIIILLQEPSAAEVTQSCLPSLQRELHFLSHGIRKLLEDSELKASGVSDDHSEAEGDDIRKVGEKFKRRREKLLEKSKQEVNRVSMNNLCEQLMKISHKTDSEIVKSSSKH